MRGLCSLITSEATTAERNTQTDKHMTTDKLTPRIEKAHRTVAQWIAENYVRNLKADTNNTLPTLEHTFQTFRYEIAHAVGERMHQLGAPNSNVRWEYLLNITKAAIKFELCNDEVLRVKLCAIREAQRVKENAEHSAQIDSWRAVPVAS